MLETFDTASAFNQELGSWNVANVTTLEEMFETASAFNQDIDSWNVAQVTTLAYTFYEASAFNQALGSWNVAYVVTLEGTFESAPAFNQELGSWNVAKVTSPGQGDVYAGSWRRDGDVFHPLLTPVHGKNENRPTAEVKEELNTTPNAG